MRDRTPIILSLILIVFLATHPLKVFGADEEARSIDAMITTLEKDLTALRFLISKIEVAKSNDREVLVYRQDERVFKLLADYDALAQNITGLPEGASQKTLLAAQLTEFGTDLGPALFNRIDEIKQTIFKHNTLIKELSGATQIAAQAYVSSLESVQIKYYESLATHIGSRDVLGLGSNQLRETLAPIIYLYAETLAGRIEFTGAARQSVQDRLADDSGNADINAALKDLAAIHNTNIHRLESVIFVMDTLGLESSEYQTVMLQQASNLSVSYFSADAIVSVIQDSWAALKEAIEENAPDLIFRFFLFVIVIMIFRILSRSTKKLVRAATDRSKQDMSELLKNILVSTSGGTVMAIGFLMALSQVGISLAPMLAGLGVMGFIVGFALQDSLGNFASGAMILIYRPFDVDDFVEVTGASGLVKKMNLVSTTIVTFDNQTLVVPNSKIWGDVIKNVTAQTERRVDLEFGIGYDDDIELAERVLADIVKSTANVLAEPEPTIKLHTLGDSSVNFIVRPWTKTEDYWDVYWDIIREVKMRFDREGISIPYPQSDVHLHTVKED